MRAYTESDFDALSWHDDSVYGLSFRIGDPARNDWANDLVLDIDPIVEWVRAAEQIRFRATSRSCATSSSSALPGASWAPS